MKQTSFSLRRPVSSESIALTTMLCAVGTLAAQTGPAAPAPASLSEVVVEASAEPTYKPETVSSPKYTQPLRDIPQTITVIPQTVIQAQGATSLRDVLRNVPGISMQAGEGGGGLPGDNLSIRGFNSRTDLFVDGVRDYGSYSRDPYNIEQVEVAKGPASSTAGRGSTGGAINLVTKTPKAESFYRSDITGGTDDLFRGTIDINMPLWSRDQEVPAALAPSSSTSGKGIVGIGKAPVAAAPVSSTESVPFAAFRLNGVFNTGDTPGRNYAENERWGVAPSLAFGLGTDTRLTLTYSHFEEDNVPDYGIPWVPLNTNPALSSYSNKAAPVSFDNWYGLNGYDFEKTETDLAGVLFEHDFSPSIKLRNFTRYGLTHRESAITAPRFNSVNTITLLNRQLQQREIENEIWSNQTDVTFSFNTGTLEHSLVVGLEFARENQDNRNSAQTANQPLADLHHPDANQKPFGPLPEITRTVVNNGIASQVGIPNSATADTVSAYLFDTVKIGKHWEVTGGARYDHVDADYDNSATSFNSTDDMLSWRAALVFKPVEQGSIYFGYGTSFNPSIDGNVGLTLTPQNQDLDPEETGTFELGTKWDVLDNRLSLTAAVFHTEKDHARTVDPTDPLAVTVLDGKQRVQGFELGAAGKITDWWNIFGGYTYLDSEVKSSRNPAEVGKELSNTPENSLSLWTTFDLPGRVTIGGGAQFVDSRFNNNINQREADSYWTFDAMASWQVTKNFGLRLNVYNLADERYIDRVGGGHFVPGVGRSATLTASVSF
ncbi:MAG: TonB-dependent siderophore receptor family protein [Verrucomicrobiales bacterium]|nr:TonB-dependent siderophore receptor family protein [Verrucomicrobiales bacterium]